MVNYREILRLKSLKYSNTDIAASVHSSRNTMQEVLRLSKALNIQWPLEDDVSNFDLEAVLYPERHKKDENRLIPDYPEVHRELAKPGVTITLLWTEYCAEAAAAGKKPYMSTQFSDGYRSGSVPQRQQCESLISPVLKWKWTGLAIPSVSMIG
ncbi:MAG: hypothetical protein ACOX78_06020 [Lachnospiraceae bacterium]|jgi:hypothetical protein